MEFLLDFVVPASFPVIPVSSPAISAFFFCHSREGPVLG